MLGNGVWANFTFFTSAVIVSLLAFAAERNLLLCAVLRCGASSAAAVDRYLLPARHSAANPPHTRDSLETTVNIINMETCSTSDLRELNLSWEDVTAAAAAEDRQLCGPLHDVCGMNQRQT